MRGDRESKPPCPRAPVSFDDIVALDLPAVVDAVLGRSGAARVHLVGHGFGGQLALGWMAREGDAQVASLTTLSAPVRFGGLHEGRGALSLAADAEPPQVPHTAARQACRAMV